MTAIEVLSRIKSHPGSMMPVVIESHVDTLKNVQGVAVVKRSRLFVTAGTEFANRKDVREAIESGERGEVGPLPWGVWKHYPFIIEHTPAKGPYAGQLTEYVRLFPPTEAQTTFFNLTGEVQFYADGQPITREQAIAYCGSKAKADDAKREAFAVAVGNIVSI